MKYKVIFCDVDGVLNSAVYAQRQLAEVGYDPTEYDEFDPSCVIALDKIVRKTGARIVLSSSWRWNPISFKHAIENLHNVGLTIYDTTSLNVDTTLTRTQEICNYLLAHEDQIDNYVILDDTNINTLLADHWVKTTMEYGLTFDLANKAISILNKE